MFQPNLYALFCNELLLLLLAANIKVTNILHKLIRMSRYIATYTTKYYYKICTIYQRNYLVHLFLIMPFREKQIQTLKINDHCIVHHLAFAISKLPMRPKYMN